MVSRAAHRRMPAAAWRWARSGSPARNATYQGILSYESRPWAGRNQPRSAGYVHSGGSRLPLKR
jgi:hypothetical protein